MKKILILLDPVHAPDPILNFIRNLYFEQIFALKIIFLDTGKPALDLSQTNINRIESFCKDHHFRHTIFSVFDEDVKRLYEETRYTDVLVLDGNGWDHPFLDDLLHQAACPVVLLPSGYKTHYRNIFAYDGSVSCMHALRQFIQLFPHFLDLDTLIVHADEDNAEIPRLPLLKEYLQQHFSSLAYYHLKADKGEDLNNWLGDKGKVMIISGAKGRTAFSELLKRSFMEEIIREDHVPVFLAHL